MVIFCESKIGFPSGKSEAELLPFKKAFQKKRFYNLYGTNSANINLSQSNRLRKRAVLRSKIGFPSGKSEAELLPFKKAFQKERFFKYGDPPGNRTRDTLIKSQVLYRLS